MAEGDVVAVVESMKMETSLTAPFAGRVRRVLTGTNVQVPAHTPLLQLEAIEDEAAEQSAERVDVRAHEDRARRERARPRWTACAGCCWATTSAATRSGARSATLRDGDGGAELIAGEHRLLDVFSDVRALSRARHDPERELLHSPQEYLHAFLRSLDAKAERPARALRHACSSARSPTTASTAWTARPRSRRRATACSSAQERADLARAAVMAILERRLSAPASSSARVGDEFRGVLDRLELATERRDPVIADQARQLRNRYFDQPLILAAPGARPTRSSRSTCSALLEDPDRADRAEQIDRRRRGAAAAGAAADRAA